MGSRRPPAFSIFGKWCPGAPERRLEVSGYSSPSGHAGRVFPLGERGQHHHGDLLRRDPPGRPVPLGILTWMITRAGFIGAFRAETPDPNMPRQPVGSAQCATRLRMGTPRRPMRSRPISVSFSAIATRSGPDPLLELAGSGTLTGGRTARWSAQAPVIQRQR
jgi:hypothetical protein